jgi:hypothetical protein
MSEQRQLALEAVQHIKKSPGFQELSAPEQARLGQDLSRIAAALGEQDPWDAALETPLDLQRRLAAGRGGTTPAQRPTQTPTRPPARQPAPQATAQIGERIADTLEAVDLPGFVAGLVTGTFQAIVDATAQQVREYAQLVSSISRSVDDFSRDNVTPNQVREWLAERYPGDLCLTPPRPGSSQALVLEPCKGKAGSSPAWLADYDLADEALSRELTDGTLVARARNRLGEERLQSLATMVLMGINRIVVNEGHIRTKLQFHAAARDRRKVEMQQLTAGQAAGIAGRQVSMARAARTQVSTARANVQADASIKADLMGEVNLVFSTETFPLADFADTPAIQLIQRHARWKTEPGTEAAPAGQTGGQTGAGSGGGTGNAPGGGQSGSGGESGAETG